jgi:hypothetical protein
MKILKKGGKGKTCVRGSRRGEGKAKSKNDGHGWVGFVGEWGNGNHRFG